METTEKIKARLAKMLRDTREERGMKLGEFTRLAGWKNYQTLSSIDNGTRDVKASELSRLARIYGKAMEYFLFGPRQPEKASVLWRAVGDDKQAKMVGDMFKESLWAYIKLERVNEDEKKFTPTQIKPEDVTWKWVDQQAKSYSEKLGGRPARTLERVLENDFGVKIFHFCIGRAGSAASTIMDGHAGVLINAENAPWRRNYNLAHEFFHLITWDVFPENEIHCGNSSDKPLAETLADRFAAALLMPTQEILLQFNNRVKNGKISLLDIVLLALEFDVSREALLWRLGNLKCFNNHQVRELLKNETLQQIDKHQRKDKWQEKQAFSQRFVQLGFRAMMNGYLSRAKFAEYLQIPLPGLAEFLVDYDLSEEEDYSVEINTA